MKIILVEDGTYKRDRILEFLKKDCLECQVDVFGSYSSGVKAMDAKDYDFAILDMSLPTFDSLSGKGGGNFKVYGGLEIARQIKRRSLSPKFVFLTQYKSFSEDPKLGSISDIEDISIRDYGDRFLGYIVYEHAGFKWKEELKKVIDNNE